MIHPTGLHTTAGLPSEFDTPSCRDIISKIEESTRNPCFKVFLEHLLNMPTTKAQAESRVLAALRRIQPQAEQMLGEELHALRVEPPASLTQTAQNDAILASVRKLVAIIQAEINDKEHPEQIAAQYKEYFSSIGLEQPEEMQKVIQLVVTAIQESFEKTIVPPLLFGSQESYALIELESAFTAAIEVIPKSCANRDKEIAGLEQRFTILKMQMAAELLKSSRMLLSTNGLKILGTIERCAVQAMQGTSDLTFEIFKKMHPFILAIRQIKKDVTEGTINNAEDLRADVLEDALSDPSQHTSTTQDKQKRLTSLPSTIRFLQKFMDPEQRMMQGLLANRPSTAIRYLQDPRLQARYSFEALSLKILESSQSSSELLGLLFENPHFRETAARSQQLLSCTVQKGLTEENKSILQWALTSPLLTIADVNKIFEALALRKASTLTRKERHVEAIVGLHPNNEPMRRTLIIVERLLAYRPGRLSEADRKSLILQLIHNRGDDIDRALRFVAYVRACGAEFAYLSRTTPIPHPKDPELAEALDASLVKGVSRVKTALRRTIPSLWKVQDALFLPRQAQCKVRELVINAPRIVRENQIVQLTIICFCTLAVQWLFNQAQEQTSS